MIKETSQTIKTQEITKEDLLQKRDFMVLAKMKKEIQKDISSRTRREHFEGFIASLKDLMIVLEK